MDSTSVGVKVFSWCAEQEDPQMLGGQVPGYSFQFLDFTVNVHRFDDSGFTRVSSGVALVGSDLDFFKKIGESMWRDLVKNTNAVLNRSEVCFEEASGTAPIQTVPAYAVADKMYDDGFTIDELYRTVRGVATAALHILYSLKTAKTQFFKGTEGWK